MAHILWPQKLIFYIIGFITTEVILTMIYTFKVDATEQEIVKCPHCNVKGPQWKIQDHESNICMEKVIPCTNAPYGCDLMLKRQVLFHNLLRNELTIY